MHLGNKASRATTAKLSRVLSNPSKITEAKRPLDRKPMRIGITTALILCVSLTQSIAVAALRTGIASVTPVNASTWLGPANEEAAASECGPTG